MSARAAAQGILSTVTSPLMKPEWVEQLDWESIMTRQGWSSGEYAIIAIALAVWNGSRSARVSELLALSNGELTRILLIISEGRGLGLTRMTPANFE